MGHGGLVVSAWVLTFGQGAGLSPTGQEGALERSPSHGSREARTETGTRAMWVWHVEDYLPAKSRAKLLRFAKKEGINTLWCQIHTAWSKNGTRAKIKDEAKWASFLSEAHQNGIKVHALDGERSYALKQNHPKMLSQAKAIIAFNRKRPPAERFDGIHHDNEVYLTEAWKEGPAKQRLILKDALVLAKKLQRLLQKADVGLVYGVDIPFWYDQTKRSEGGGFELTFGGTYATAAEHFIRLCDNVGIMDYRNFARGTDGIIYHGRQEVAIASRLKKKSIILGVETGKFEPKKITFHGLSRTYLKGQLAETKRAFTQHPGFEGVAIHHYRSFRALR